MQNDNGEKVSGSTRNDLRQVSDLALFAKIVQSGGISRCAAQIGVDRTTVSRRLKDLEQELGIKLLERTPKRIFVTEAGKRCFEQCELLLDAAKNAYLVATSGRQAVKPEPLSVAAAPHLLEIFLDAKLGEFEQAHPNVTIERHPTSAIDYSETSGPDICVEMDAPSTSSSIFASKISCVRQSVYASPAYLQKHSEPQSPFDLDKHKFVVETHRSEERVLEFDSDIGSVRVPISEYYMVSGILEARESTLAGLAMAILPDYLCGTFQQDGRLVKLLTEFRAAKRDVHIVCPKRGHIKPRTANLRMFLEDAFRSHIL